MTDEIEQQPETDGTGFSFPAFFFAMAVCGAILLVAWWFS